MNVSLAMVKVGGDAGIIEWPEIAKGVVGVSVSLIRVIAMLGAGVVKANIDEPMRSPLKAKETIVSFLVRAGPE